MNILPKKKWHVRTKENMARVRKDEAKAAEEEKRRLDRAILAENERRMDALRSKADDRMESMFGRTETLPTSQKDSCIFDETGHVNFFQDLEREERKNLGTGNKEYEEEKKKEQHEWESKMGIQKKFAEGTNELDKKSEWYESIPLRTRKEVKPVPSILPQAVKQTVEESSKERSRHKKKKKRRHRSSTSSDSSDDNQKKKKKSKRNASEDREKEEAAKKAKLMEMRDERMKRERQERLRQEQLLHPERFKAPPAPKQKEDNINRNWTKAPNTTNLKRDNSHLSERGKLQAKEVATRFQKIKIDHIFASPYDRTIETAVAIAANKDLRVKPEPGLCEALYLCEKPPSFWENKELQEKYPLVDHEYLPIFSKHTLPKEGYGDDACIPRLRTTIERLTGKYDGDLLFVGHGASIGAIHEIISGEFKYVGQATVTKITQLSPDKFRLDFSSCANHLSDKTNLRPW